MRDILLKMANREALPEFRTKGDEEYAKKGSILQLVGLPMN